MKPTQESTLEGLPYLTCGDLFEFIKANKGNKTFIGYDDKRIVDMMLVAIKNQTLYYHTNSYGKIVGMILATIDSENGILFVDENLAMTLETLKMFARRAKKDFPNLNLQWMKNGVYKMHNTKRIYDKLS